MPVTVNADCAVAFVGPLTGAEAVVAGPMLAAARRGAEAAAAEAGLRVELRAVDDGRDPARAAEILAALLADPQVIGVVGPKNSGSVRAAVSAIGQSSLCLVLPAATATDLGSRLPGRIFRMCATDDQTASAVASLCATLSLRSLLVRSDDTAYGRGLAAAVRAAVGSRCVMSDDETAADGVFHAMGEVEQAVAVSMLRRRGFRGALIGAEGGPQATLPALAGGAAEGAYQLYAGAPVTGASCVYAPEAADAARVLVHAAARAGDRDGMPAALAVTSLLGESGEVRFGADGERSGADVSIWRVVDGESRPVEPAGLSGRRNG